MKKLVLTGGLLLAMLAPARADQELNEAAATIVNANGFLCAKVVDIRDLGLHNGDHIFEVTCVKWRNGSKQATYILNGDTNVVFEDD